MADVYVNSAATGANNGTSKTDAYVSLTACQTGGGLVATNSVYLSHTHSEQTGVGSAGSRSYDFPTTGSGGLRLFSVNFSGSTPPVAADLTPGALIDVGNVSQFCRINQGKGYVYGVTFRAGANNAAAACSIGQASGSPTSLWLESCTLEIPGTHSNTHINLGLAAGSNQQGCFVALINCTCNFNGAVGGQIRFQEGRIYIENLTIGGSVTPTTLFNFRNDTGSFVEVVASNLSGKTFSNLVDVSGDANGVLLLRQCKMPSGFAVTTGSFNSPLAKYVELVDCNSGDDHQNFIHKDSSGTVTLSKSIYADAGNADANFSWQMVSSSLAKPEFPLISPYAQKYHNGTSSIQVTIPIVYDNATNLTNAEIWLEAMAKITSTSAKSTVNVGDRAATLLTTPADQDADTGTSWIGTGSFANENKDKLVSGAFTPAEVGVLAAVVKLGKASTTVYVSPNLSIS